MNLSQLKKDFIDIINDLLTMVFNHFTLTHGLLSF
jgi:hypothetical protein